MRRGERVDTAWTFTEIIHGHRVLFRFMHGVTSERAEGNVMGARDMMRARYGEATPSPVQLAARLAELTEAIEYVEVQAVIGHGAVAWVVKREGGL